MRHVHGSVTSFLAAALIAPTLALDWRSHAAALPFQDQPKEQTLQETDSEIARWTAQLRSADVEERRQAVLMLAAIGDRAAASAITPALNDPSPRVRAVAINGLATYGDKSFVPLIAARLAQDKIAFVRKVAAYGLGRLQSSDATPALVAALKDKDIEVRGAAAVALCEYQDAAAIPALINALADKQEFVRAQAARALGMNGRASAQAVPLIVKLLDTDKDHEVKRQAATALGRIGERSALPALERAQRSPDPYLSQAALEAIGRIQDTGVRSQGQTR